jgi:flavodoxin I
MKVLIIYDSVYGNTEKIARAIGNAVAGDVSVMRPKAVDYTELESADLLIVGAPTYGGRPTDPIKNFLKSIPQGAVQNTKVAAFDTRLKTRLVKIFGYAAKGIARSLVKMGANLILPAEGFFVKGTQGPLIEGEIERAAAWTKKLLSISTSS